MVPAVTRRPFYRPKGSAAALFLEGKAGLLRLKQDIPLTEAEAAAVEDGVTAFDALLKQLTDIPTPAGPTPRQLQETSGRGCSADTIRAFGIGAYSGKGLLRGRIVIPIHNERCELVAYAGRAIDEQEPKYRFPAGFRKSLALFNLHRALATGTRTTIVVEGFFDTLAVHQAGYPAVVGLMGPTVSRYQADLLATHFDRVVLMLDGDEAGRQGAPTIAQALARRMAVTVISLEDGRQPDQLASADIQGLVRPHLDNPTSARAPSSMMERTTVHEQSCSDMSRHVPVVSVAFEHDRPDGDDSERQGWR